MEETLENRILEILSAHNLMALATVRADGYPQTTTVGYVHDGLTLYFACDAVSQKAGNLKLNDKVSLAITGEPKNFYKLRGVSLSGTAQRILDKPKANEITLRLFKALPQAKRFVPADENDIAVFAVTPVAISLIDYTKGYGQTQLLEL